MPKRFHLNRPDRAKEVIAAPADCDNVSDQQRLLAMRLAWGGHLPGPQIAEPVGVSRRQFFNWVGLLKAEGVADLLANRHGGGPPPKVKGKLLEEFQAGLKAGRWKRAKEIQHWLRREHQVKLGLKGVYYWLGKLGGVLKVPRKAHAKKDAAKTKQFQEQLCDKLKNLNVAGGKAVLIWVTDEHRYGLIPVVRKCWTLRGERPTAPYQTKYEWGYLYSALEVDGENAAEFLCLPRVDLEMSWMF